MKTRRGYRVREEHSPYGNVVVMPATLLDVGVKSMHELKKKALKVSRALQKAGVPHAIIGGLVVAAHVARVELRARLQEVKDETEREKL